MLSSLISCFAQLVTILQLLIFGCNSSRNDTSSLLAGTLFVFKDRACNNEKLLMRCPPGTGISVRWAQYGRPSSSESLCPPIERLQEEQKQRPRSLRKLHRPFNESTSSSSSLECLAPTSLQVVVNLCQGLSRCHVTASPQVFGVDPCPGIDKVLKVGYQCRPRELITRSACRGNAIELRCSSRRRIALHSAFYGYSPIVNVTDCALEPAFDAECSSVCSEQTVARLCLGRRHCRLQADGSVFGRPCLPETKEYLVVVFACVALRTLKEIQDDFSPFSTCRELDSAAVPLTNASPFVHTGPSDDPNTTSALTSAYVLASSSVPKTRVRSCAEEFLGDILWISVYVKDNFEKFWLYLIVALCIGSLLMLLVIIVRLSVTVFRYQLRIQQLKSIELRHSPVLMTSGQTEGEVVIERSVHPSPEPERPRRGGGGGAGGGHHRRTTSSPGSPAFAHIWDSPVFVHVESPHESPVLGQQPAESPLESPVWVRAPPAAASPSPVPISAESLVWQLPEHPTPMLQLSPSVPCSPVPQMVNGSRPLGETRSLSMSYTNPFRHDPYRTERRSHSVRPSRHRLPFE